MLPKYHILFGFAFVYILVQFFNFSLFAGLIIFLSSVLIDVDHYFKYIIKKKKFHLIKFYKSEIRRTEKWRKLKQQQKSKYKLPQFVFHGIEFIAILLLLSFINKFFLWILIGVVFHMVFGYISIIYFQDPIYLKFSQIYIYIRNKNKKEFK